MPISTHGLADNNSNDGTNCERGEIGSNWGLCSKTGWTAQKLIYCKEFMNYPEGHMTLNLPKELYHNYHRRRKADLEKLKQAVMEKDADAFKNLGHQLKGNAPTYGYDELATIGKNMETVTTEDISTKGQSIISDFAHWIEVTESQLPM